LGEFRGSAHEGEELKTLQTMDCIEIRRLPFAFADTVISTAFITFVTFEVKHTFEESSQVLASFP
jgi:hypothetical protein